MPTTTFHRHTNVKVTTQPNIGLDTPSRQLVIDILNTLIVDETALGLKIRRAGEQGSSVESADLQVLYGAPPQYIHNLLVEIVERVHILGGSSLTDSEKITDSARSDRSLVEDDGGWMCVLAEQEALIRLIREDAQICSEMYEDQGTFVLLVRMLRAHERMAWRLRQHIQNVQLSSSKIPISTIT